ncbi:MAG: hypothetical protein ACI8PB_002232 [Desulforhopalus sp.]|jgi:hypothetical protein
MLEKSSLLHITLKALTEINTSSNKKGSRLPVIRRGLLTKRIKKCLIRDSEQRYIFVWVVPHRYKGKVENTGFLPETYERLNHLPLSGDTRKALISI